MRMLRDDLYLYIEIFENFARISTYIWYKGKYHNVATRLSQGGHYMHGCHNLVIFEPCLMISNYALIYIPSRNLQDFGSLSIRTVGEK